MAQTLRTRSVLTLTPQQCKPARARCVLVHICGQRLPGAGLVLIKASSEAIVVAIIYVVVVDDGIVHIRASPSTPVSTPAPAMPVFEGLTQQHTAQETCPSAQ